MQCGPNALIYIKTNFFLYLVRNISESVIRNFAKFIGKHLCWSDLKALVPFLSLENTLENYAWNQYWIANYLCYRSSRSKMFFKIGVLKIFANFTKKHLCWSLFSTNFLTNFIKKTLQRRRFPVKFAKFLRAPFSTEHLRWFLLHVMLSV